MTGSTLPLRGAKRLQTIPWLAIRTRSRHEKFVFNQLERHGIQAYLPVVQIKRDWGGRAAVVDSVLLPGYCFTQTEYPRKVLELVGVAGFVTFQSRPAEIPQSEIDILREATDNRYRARPHDGDFTPMQAVRIKGTPFDGQSGNVEMQRGQRVRVILTASIGKSFSVEIPRTNVEAL